MTTRLVIVVGDHTELVRIDPVFPPVPSRAQNDHKVDGADPELRVKALAMVEVCQKIADLRIELESREP